MLDTTLSTSLGALRPSATAAPSSLATIALLLATGASLTGVTLIVVSPLTERWPSLTR
ncbi:MAG: hypothetical protein V5B38_23725 [Candidatus Accumulibacter propinquus]|jgi:hypothetical protein